MTPTPKTIQIYLPGGDPRGIRVAEITTRIVQVIDVPRSLLAEFLKLPESQQVAVYFLIGAGDDGRESSVYIGQTGDLRMRLTAHAQNKDFWQRALVMISRTHSLTQTHALFLEWYSIQATKNAGRYTAENGNSGTQPHTPAPMRADCLEIFDTGRVLLSALGFPIFDPVAVAIGSPSTAADAFVSSTSGIDARGQYTPEGFVVLKGSIGRRESQPSLTPSHQKQREALIEAGVVRVVGDTLVFEKDHLFASPSAAMNALTGRPSNGWKEWKTPSGETLRDAKGTETGVEA